MTIITTMTETVLELTMNPSQAPVAFRVPSYCPSNDNFCFLHLLSIFLYPRQGNSKIREPSYVLSATRDLSSFHCLSHGR